MQTSYGCPVTVTEDERRLLDIIVARTEPAERFSLCVEINPPPEPRDGRTRAAKEWQVRQLELIKALVALENRGLVRTAVPADGADPDLLVITEEGRAARQA